MRGVQKLTRAQWIGRVLGDGKRLTVKQVERVIRRQQVRGWWTAMSADGPAYEQVVFIHEGHPLAATVKACIGGQRRFEQAVIDSAIGAPISTPIGAIRLAKAGFGIVSAAAGEVELLACDAHEARYVNEARCGVPVRGYAVRRIIEAFLHYRNPNRSRVNVNDNRRLAAAEALETKWGIACEDLLDGRKRVRLVSAWMFPLFTQQDSATRATSIAAGA